MRACCLSVDECLRGNDRTMIHLRKEITSSESLCYADIATITVSQAIITIEQLKNKNRYLGNQILEKTAMKGKRLN